MHVYGGTSTHQSPIHQDLANNFIIIEGETHWTVYNDRQQSLHIVRLWMQNCAKNCSQLRRLHS